MNADNEPVDWRQVHERIFQLRDQGLNWDEVGEQIEHIFGLDRPYPRVTLEMIKGALKKRMSQGGFLDDAALATAVMELLYPSPSEGEDIHFNEPLVVPKEKVNDDPIVFTLRESQIPTIHLDADQERWLDGDGGFMADVNSPLCSDPGQYIRTTGEHLARHLAVERAVTEQRARESRVRVRADQIAQELAPVLYPGRSYDHLDTFENGVVVRAAWHIAKREADQ